LVGRLLLLGFDDVLLRIPSQDGTVGLGAQARKRICHAFTTCFSKAKMTQFNTILEAQVRVSL
jgi:hypothetical protein